VLVSHADLKVERHVRLLGSAHAEMQLWPVLPVEVRVRHADPSLGLRAEVAA
jgi:hypothetical protein